jgi:hypothetical protein
VNAAQLRAPHVMFAHVTEPLGETDAHESVPNCAE